MKDDTMNWVRSWGNQTNLADCGPVTKNDPALLALVPVQILRPFCLRGRRCEVGTTAQIERALALSLQAIGKCQLLDDEAGSGGGEG